MSLKLPFVFISFEIGAKKGSFFNGAIFRLSPMIRLLMQVYSAPFLRWATGVPGDVAAIFAQTRIVENSISVC